MSSSRDQIYRPEALRARGRVDTIAEALKAYGTATLFPWVLLLLLLAGFAVFSLSRMDVTVNGPATVRRVGSAAVYASLSGSVAEVFVREGEAVGEGSPVVRVQATAEEAELVAAEEEMAEWVRDALRNPHDSAIDTVGARAGVARWRTLVERSTVEAPRAGHVLTLRVSVGDYVRQGDVIATLSDGRESVEAYAIVPQHLGGAVQLGSRAEFRLQNAPLASVGGTVSGVSAHVASWDDIAAAGEAKSPAPAPAPAQGLVVRVELDEAAVRSGEEVFDLFDGSVGELEVLVESPTLVEAWSRSLSELRGG